MKKTIMLGVIIIIIIITVILKVFILNNIKIKKVSNNAYNRVPVLIAKRKGFILNSKDFYFLNKDKKYSIVLGMDIQKVLNAVGPINSNNGEGYENYRKYWSEYSFAGGGFIFDKKLNSLATIEINNINFKSWEIYKNINFYSSKEKIIDTFGQPTNEYKSLIDNKNVLSYFFYKTEEGKYKKLNNKNEVELIVINKQIVKEMRMFVFNYDTEDSKINYTRLSYLDLDGDISSNSYWRILTGLYK